MIWRPNVKKSTNLVSILLAIVSAVPVCPFREKEESVMADVSWCPWGFQKIILLWNSHVCMIVFSHGLSVGQLEWFLTHACLSFILNVFIIVEQPWQQDFAVVARHSV